MKFTFTPESRPLEGYTIKRAIYRGGFGEVYYALTDAGREVALKLLQNNTEVELRGVQQCLNLSHPNLVTIFDVRTDKDGDHWIIMEYVAGETLDAAIHRHPEGMPLEKIRGWLSGMTQGIAYLHERGIVHRDLKPGNVFSDGGVVKIGDVGLSKFITPSRRSAQTQSVGTVYYMAPEVAKGRYGLEVDVYAMGIILYEMLTGRVPFEGESTGEILMKHLSEKPDLEKLPPRLRPVIGKALEKDPAARFATIGELHEAFELAVIGKYRPVPQPAGGRSAAAQPATQSAAHAQPRAAGGTAHLAQTAPYGVGAAKSPWHPTRRAFWLMLLAGLLPRLVTDARGEEALAMSMLASSAVYLLYGLSRQNQWESSRKLVEWLDADSRPTGNWHWAGLAAFQYFIAVPFNRARPDDVFEVGIPVALVMGVAGWVLSKVLPSANAIDAFQQEVGEEAEKIRSVASELERRQAQAAARTSQPVYRSVGESPRRPSPPVDAGHRHYYRYQAIDPSLPRKIPARARLMQFASAAALAVPIILLLTTILVLAGRPLFVAADASQNVALIAGTSGTEVSLGLLGLFMLTAIAATWVLLALSKLSEGRKLQSGSRRLAQLVGGLIVGVVAASAADYLMVSNTQAVSGAGDYFRLDPGQTGALFVSVGEQPLAQGSVPSLAGYLIFFGALFALRRWWWHSDPFRSKRFRISSVLLTVLAAWLISSVWAFPQLWAMTWAAVISSSIQLAAPWTPREERCIAREG
jgi:eukaryotic-like serine/threonine-protein kinase